MGKTRGFTLIELMVTIAVLAVIAMMAVPAFTKTIRKSQLLEETRDFVDLLAEKRSEAIFKQNSRVFALDSNVSPCISPICTRWSVPLNIVKESGDASVTFNRVGQSTAISAQCFIFKHSSDATLKSYVLVQTGGTILYDKTATRCPA